MLKDAEANYEDLTIVSLDLDFFKRVNDTFGHETGDIVLKEVGQILLDIPAEHKTYRQGGEEFAIVFPNTEKEKVFLIMEETRKKIAESPECLRTSTTASAGIATFAEDGNNDVELLRKANGALYRAKSSGRNKIALAKEEKLVTKTAHYTVEQLKQLEKLSKKKNITEAALMREALDELLRKYKE
ncbi:MAG: GGDEF domain-containing protein [Oscillospiraceae bacterium]|nr:GGDEF domain-containing protein [Oscillospiraceae bacterium]